MGDAQLYGVELDSITGRIAKQLYPKANITVSGFEHVNLPDNSIDLAVGNVPFGNYRLSDPRYKQYGFLIHDYFFAKTLDKVRTGGIVAFITSKGTMDKQDTAVREYLAQRADLLGAVRLPSSAFPKPPTRRSRPTFCSCKSGTRPRSSFRIGYSWAKRLTVSLSTVTMNSTRKWCSAL